jgi:hypothetical protein
MFYPRLLVESTYARLCTSKVPDSNFPNYPANKKGLSPALVLSKLNDSGIKHQEPVKSEDREIEKTAHPITHCPSPTLGARRSMSWTSPSAAEYQVKHWLVRPGRDIQAQMHSVLARQQVANSRAAGRDRPLPVKRAA